MKVTIEEIEDLKETEINIKCRNITPELLELINDFKYKEQRVIGTNNDESFFIEHKDIYYIDTVDDRVFAYTKDKIFTLNFKLYELEKMLPAKDFFRVSKSTIINIAHIISLKTLFNGKIQATMKSGELIIISRSYATLFKEKLGVNKR